MSNVTPIEQYLDDQADQSKNPYNIQHLVEFFAFKQMLDDLARKTGGGFKDISKVYKYDKDSLFVAYDPEIYKTVVAGVNHDRVVYHRIVKSAVKQEDGAHAIVELFPNYEDFMTLCVIPDDKGQEPWIEVTLKSEQGNVRIVIENAVWRVV